MRRFAEKTTVAVEKSRAELERLLEHAKADSIGIMRDKEKAVIACRLNGRNIRFDLSLPTLQTINKRSPRRNWDNVLEQELRQRWRALLLVVKAKLESVASNIESFDEAFLAHVVMPDGQTVGQHVMGPVALAYQSGEMPTQLMLSQ